MGKGNPDSGSSWFVPIVVALIGAIATVVVAVLSNPTTSTGSAPIPPARNVCSESIGLVALTQYWSGEREDNYATTLWSGTGHRTAGSGAEYAFSRLEGYVFPPDAPQPPGTIPLTQYWNDERGDNYATTLWSGTRHRTAGSGAEYAFSRLEGYVFPPDVPQPPGTIPLTQYWNDERGDNYATTFWSGTGYQTAGSGAEYGFSRLEGYVCPPP